MKHTLIIGIATLAVSACTCTCPEKQYDFQYVQPNYQTIQAKYQPADYQIEFLPPSHMMTHYDKNMHLNTMYQKGINLNGAYNQNINSDASIEYRRYTQIRYVQPQAEYQYSRPQEAEVIYYPVYQPQPVQPKYQDYCGCLEYNSCGC